MPKVTPFGQRVLQVVVDRNLEAGFARHQHRLGLDGELQFQSKQAEHVGDNTAVEMISQLPQIFSESREPYMIGREQLKELDIQIESGTHPLARGRTSIRRIADSPPGQTGGKSTLRAS